MPAGLQWLVTLDSVEGSNGSDSNGEVLKVVMVMIMVMVMIIMMVMVIMVMVV